MICHDRSWRAAQPPSESHHKKSSVEDAYTKDSTSPHIRPKTSLPCYEAISWGKGKSLQDIINCGLKKGVWQ